jgi:hypothetical protein
LEQAVAHFGVDVLEHLDREVEIPVIAGLPQRQGDVIVLPAPKTTVAATQVVGSEGVAVVRGENGRNTHALLPGLGGPVFFDFVPQRTGSLRIGTLTVPEGSAGFLAHPEHGYVGFGPGTYEVRRQREQADEIRMVAD